MKTVAEKKINIFYSTLLMFSKLFLRHLICTFQSVRYLAIYLYQIIYGIRGDAIYVGL